MVTWAKAGNWLVDKLLPGFILLAASALGGVVVFVWSMNLTVHDIGQRADRTSSDLGRFETQHAADMARLEKGVDAATARLEQRIAESTTRLEQRLGESASRNEKAQDKLDARLQKLGADAGTGKGSVQYTAYRPGQGPHWHEGRLGFVNKDRAELTLKWEYGRIRTFETSPVANGCRVVIAGKTAKIEDLHAGDFVIIVFGYTEEVQLIEKIDDKDLTPPEH